MDVLLTDLMEKITVYNLITVTFVLGFLAVVIRLTVAQGIQYQKICVAFAIFLVALIVNKTFFYVVSIAIGGTLVAGKEFMLMLTCIWRARREDMIKAILAYIQTIESASAPAEENEQEIPAKPTASPDKLRDIPITKK